jgi:hypothetical protein
MNKLNLPEDFGVTLCQIAKRGDTLLGFAASLR